MEIDKALKIIQNTNDGDELSPNHLYIVQQVVNGLATEYELETFNKIHEDVVNGCYKKPWLCGIEHMTADHEGYIYYKGHRVEHYSFEGFKSRQKLIDELTWLQDKCIHAEKLRLPINTLIIIWYNELWSDINDPKDPIVFYLNNKPIIYSKEDTLAISKPIDNNVLHIWSVTDKCYQKQLQIQHEDLTQFIQDHNYNMVTFKSSSDIKSFMKSTGLDFKHLDEEAFEKFLQG